MLKLLCCLFLAATVHNVSPLGGEFPVAAKYDAAVDVITLSWKNDDRCVKAFVLQRSEDEEEWINLDTLYNADVFYNQQVLWEYRTPFPGGSTYRLKAVIDDYNFTFSAPIFVKGKPSMFEWDVEEAPANDKLVLQYKGEGKIKGVINVALQNMTGLAFYKARLASNTKTIEIPIANLGMGKYDIKLSVEGETIWRQRFKKQSLGSEMVCKLF